MNLTGWFPLALATDIAPGTAAGAVLDGAEIVVWRDGAGAAHVWEDRCPHRGMKMSFGFVRGDRLACLYHGWEYDGAGQCQSIPAHPDLEVPKSICITGYHGAEAGGMIWVHAPFEAAPEAGPAVTDATPVRSIYLEAPLAVAQEKLGITGAYGAIDSAHGTLGIGCQPIGPRSCALHVTALGAIDDAARLALCDWAEALRRDIETLAGKAAA